MRVSVGHVLVLCLLLLEPWHAGASVLRQNTGPDRAPLLPDTQIDPTPDCTKEMESVEGSTEIGLNSGLLVVHVSDVERNVHHENGASACHRWKTKARFDSRSIDLDRLDEGYKRVYADVTLSYRFVHVGDDRRILVDPGMNVVMGGDRPPSLYGWVDFSAHPDWTFRLEYRQDRGAYRPEERLHLEALATRYF